MTRLWPRKEVKRRIHFYNAFQNQQDNVFANYEKSGGVYHIESDDDESGDDNSDDKLSNSDTDDHDDVFV